MRRLVLRLDSLRLDELERVFCAELRRVTDDPETCSLIAGVTIEEWLELCRRSDTATTSRTPWARG